MIGAMVCRNCGTEIADKAIVCYRCGTGTADPVQIMAASPGVADPLRDLLDAATVADSPSLAD